MYGSDAGQPVPSLYTKGLSPLSDMYITNDTGVYMYGGSHLISHCLIEYPVYYH